jgi:pimeloyl-ACP methyl ester carboxylesterase
VTFRPSGPNILEPPQSTVIYFYQKGGIALGGLVALELAATYPGLAAGVCLIDSVIFPSDVFRAPLKVLSDRLAGPEYAQNPQVVAGSLFIETDDLQGKVRVLTEMAKTPHHVAVPAFRNHLLNYDASAAARACRAPTAYIAAANLIAYLHESKRLCQQLVTAQTGIGTAFATGSARTNQRYVGTLHGYFRTRAWQSKPQGCQ